MRSYIRTSVLSKLAAPIPDMSIENNLKSDWGNLYRARHFGRFPSHPICRLSGRSSLQLDPEHTPL